MRIAFVYDRVNKIGGAELILLALQEIWPDAPLYTAVYNPKRASWANGFKVKFSFLQYVPFAKSNHEFYPILTPLAFESFDFSSYDVVLSVTSAEAKGIITKLPILHICYCLTPTRYLWSGYKDYFTQPGVGILNPFARILMKVFTPSLRNWDLKAAKRPDFYLAISQNVKRRIKKYYQRESEVIYPPVDTDRFKPKEGKARGDYFLIVSRLVPYKKIDYAILVFNSLGLKLKIVGTGIDEARLKKMAGVNISFLGEISDEMLLDLYQNCQALIFPQDEDFGLTPIEAQACGKPVIAYNGGGARETVISGKTGELFDTQTKGSLISALKKFSKKYYSPAVCRKNALHFSKDIFKKNMKKSVETLYKNWKIDDI